MCNFFKRTFHLPPRGRAATGPDRGQAGPLVSLRRERGRKFSKIFETEVWLEYSTFETEIMGGNHMILRILQFIAQIVEHPLF